MFPINFSHGAVFKNFRTAIKLSSNVCSNLEGRGTDSNKESGILLRTLMLLSFFYIKHFTASFEQCCTDVE